MSRLAFEITGVRAERYAVVPLLTFRLRITDFDDQPVNAIALRAQIRIETTRRHYTGVEHERLEDLFGIPQRWGETLRSLLWTHVSAMVPRFCGSIEVDLPVPCTYDFDVAASKYLNALDDGDVPLLMLFSGTVFNEGQNGFAVAQIPWELEASYRMPARVWRDVMDFHFPNTAWIRLRKDTFDELCLFKTSRTLTTWDDALAALLDAAREKR
ncbi:MAG: hypothetical protein GIW99_06885 [Candidatus Eremiobacteraeota bacterium]|nr:hypothetical protein [Candidatus Eremiobacteraeota bacterium]MBC5827390.1 hypothetical protein [Candidatus Eremiobacteraeota bacterium]